MTVRPRDAAGQAAAGAFLARHGGVRVARGGELVRPRDHRAVVAGTAEGQLAGRLTYVPGLHWRQGEVLTLRADQRWRGAGTAVAAAGRAARPAAGVHRLWVMTINDTVAVLRLCQRRGCCLVTCTAVPSIAAAPPYSRRSRR